MLSTKFLTMEERPRIKIKLTGADKMLEIIGWLINAVTWILVIIYYPNLPDTIPVHYNGAGQADRFGEKVSVLILPVIATILFIGMTILNRFPHVFNYPNKITQENAERNYINATKLIRYLKLIVVVIFGFITLMTILIAQGDANGLGTWFLPLMVGLIIIPAAYFVVKSFSHKQYNKI